MPLQGAREGPDLRDYLQILRRRKLPFLLSLLIVVGAAVLSSQIQQPVYAATAEVLLGRRTTETPFDANTGQYVDPKRTIQTQIKILQSQPVATAVRDKLGYAAAISARPAGETDVIEITAESTLPKRAADIANAYANSYIDLRRKQVVDDVLAAGSEVQDKINDLQKQIDTVGSPLKEALAQQQALFKSKLDQLQVNATLQSGGAQLVSEAGVPSVPVHPRPVRTTVLSIFLGTFFGAGVAFLIEYLDDSVKSKEELERAAPSLSVISMIPAVASWKVRDEARVVSLTEPASPAAEAYRTLRTALQFMSVDRTVRRIQVTSPHAQEGKTTTLVNLGVSLARAGARVVIVCCDLRRPRAHEFFGLSNTVGFTSVLLGEVSLSTALQHVPDVDRLSLLSAGPLPPNPSELLQSRRAAEVFADLQDEGLFVLIDTPPVLPVSDALIVSKVVDGTLLVCNARNTKRKDVSRAIELLHTVDAPVIGAVLNGVTERTSYGYTYREYTTVDNMVPSSTGGNGNSGTRWKRGLGEVSRRISRPD